MIKDLLFFVRFSVTKISSGVESVKEHQAILDAIKCEDRHLAREMMSLHIERVLIDVIKLEREKQKIVNRRP